MNIPFDSFEEKTMARGQLFLQVAQQNPPQNPKAQVHYKHFIDCLQRLDVDGWKRFFALQETNEKPVPHVMDNPAVAAAFPADRAYLLLNKLQELDMPWWRRHGKKFLSIIALPAVGTAVKSIVDHWDKVIEVVGGLLSFMVVAAIVVSWMQLRKP